MKLGNATILITGVGGQDGSLMAELCLWLGHKVVGLTRDRERSLRAIIRPGWLSANKLQIIETDYSFASLSRIIEGLRPSVIFNFAGQSKVSLSWQSPQLNFSGMAASSITCSLLESIRNFSPDTRFISASSSEIYGHDREVLSPSSYFEPANPYGCDKLAAHTLVQSFRREHDLVCSNAIFFPHESGRRDKGFVFMKIISQAIDIKLGLREFIELGNIEVLRDWGYAPEYMVAVYKMAAMEEAKDLFISSGIAGSVREIVKITLDLLELGRFEEELIRRNDSLRRFREARKIVGINDETKKTLKWSPSFDLRELVSVCLREELRRRDSRKTVQDLGIDWNDIMVRCECEC